MSSRRKYPDVSIQPLNAAHGLSYDFKGGRGAAHFAHTRAAFTLHPGLPLSPLLFFLMLTQTSGCGVFLLLLLLHAAFHARFESEPLESDLLCNSTSFTVKNKQIKTSLLKVTTRHGARQHIS